MLSPQLIQTAVLKSRNCLQMESQGKYNTCLPNLLPMSQGLLSFATHCVMSDIRCFTCFIQCFSDLWQEGKIEFQLLCLGQNHQSFSQFLVVKKNNARFYFIFCNLGAQSHIFPQIQKYKQDNYKKKKAVMGTSFSPMFRGFVK